MGRSSDDMRMFRLHAAREFILHDNKNMVIEFLLAFQNDILVFMIVMIEVIQYLRNWSTRDINSTILSYRLALLLTWMK